MNDEYVNKGKVVALAAWGLVVALMTIAWAAMLATTHWQIAGMFAAMSCTASALAATMSIRCYAVRTACLIRATSTLGQIDGEGFDRPRSVRDR